MKRLHVLLVFIGFSEEYVARRLSIILNAQISRALVIAGINRRYAYLLCDVQSICIRPGVNDQKGIDISLGKKAMCMKNSMVKAEPVHYWHYAKLFVVNYNNIQARELVEEISVNASNSRNKATFMPKVLFHSEPLEAKKTKMFNWKT